MKIQLKPLIFFLLKFNKKFKKHEYYDESYVEESDYDENDDSDDNSNEDDYDDDESESEDESVNVEFFKMDFSTKFGFLYCLSDCVSKKNFKQILIFFWKKRPFQPKIFKGSNYHT